MPCIDPDEAAPGGVTPPLQPSLRRQFNRQLALGAVGWTGGWLAGCHSPQVPVQTSPVPAPAPAPAAATPAPPPPRVPERPAAHWDDYRLRAAHKLVQANPGKVYVGTPPEPLLAIPVIEIELRADGHVAKTTVLRKPHQALDTVQLALQAIERAAPFGPVHHLPKPWKFVEVFLFNDDRLFKPRTLDT